jgi:hypothetical protein
MLPATALGGASHAKFDFEGVAFPDDTTGTIYVGSEQTGSADTFTTCTSQADDGTFLDHFDDRN